MKIIGVVMHTNAGESDRLVYCVVAPSGRIVAERLTQTGAQRVARR